MSRRRNPDERTAEREASQDTGRRVRTLLILGFTLAGVLHVAIASRSVQATEIPLSAEFGLLQLLPPGYWVGLSLIGFGVILSIRERKESLIVVTGCVLLAVFAGTPSLFEPNPRYWDAYLHFGAAQVVLSSGSLPSAASGHYVGNWPGFFLLAATESAVSRVPALFLLKAHPFVSGGLTFLAIFVFLRSTFPRSVAGPGAVLASIFAVWGQYHVSPQSIGFILLLLILAFVWRREVHWRIAGAILFAALVVSHPTSTLILLTILVLLSFFGLFWGRSSRKARDDARFIRVVTIAYAALWAAWVFFQATGSSSAIEASILARMGDLIRLPDQTLNLATARTTENLFVLPPRLRSASLAVFAVFGLAALTLIRRSKRRRRLVRFSVASLFGIFLLAGADVVVFGGQFYDRSLLFFATITPAICLTGLKSVPFRKVRGLALVILIGASLAAASTTYYQEAFNEVPSESVAASDFLERVPPDDAVLGGMFLTPVWRDLDGRSPFSRVPFPEADLVPLAGFEGTHHVFVSFDRITELWYRQWRGLDIYHFYQAEASDHPRIYDNGGAQLYLVRS